MNIDAVFTAEKACFLKVRDTLNKPETRLEYNRAFKKPWKFYRNHTPEEAVAILRKEAQNMH